MAFFEPDACAERSARDGEVRVWSDVTEAELCERFQRLSQFLMSQHTQASGGCQVTCYLMGPLGAGKSTAARALIRHFGVTGPIKSPTYALLEPYEVALASSEEAIKETAEASSFFIGHWDLYRLSDPDEIEHLGFRDYLAQPGLQVIEWPQQGAGYLPWPDLAFDIQLVSEPAVLETDTAQLRQIQAYAFSAQGQACLAAMGASATPSANSPVETPK